MTNKFIAGTDTGEYALMVPGFTLLEEVRVFQTLGLTPYQSLKTATASPAIAMRKEKEYGTIEEGKRADFVVLNKNPLEDTENLASIFGVGLRGVWLHWQTLDWIKENLGCADSMNQLVAELESLVRS